MPGPYDAVWRRYRWLSRLRTVVFLANPVSWLYPGPKGLNAHPHITDWCLVAWVVTVWGLSIYLTSGFRCPRCGRNFYHSYALGIFNRHCMHCGLRLYEDG
jgi:hypothetical protein